MKSQVIDFLERLFGSESWPARWHCGKWSDFHGWLYIISDLLIWSAYFAIPLIIVYFIVKRRQSIPFLTVFWLFGAFILLCGLTHLIDAMIFWMPVYRLSAFLRFLTAVVSWCTVLALIKVVPLALGLKSAEDLEREIEERKKAEKALEAAKVKAEEAVVAKDNFMANMSHEIRTPINAIFGFSNLLSRTKLDAEQREYIEAVRSSSENLLTVINDILDYSKIEAGMLKIEHVPFSLHGLLHAVRILFAQRAKEKKLELIVTLSDHVPDQLMGDPIRLTQILNNLITNAIKFTEKGKVELMVDSRAGDRHEFMIHFSVKDSGIGIDEDMLAVIFDRFTQAESSTSRKFGGTGLGLSIVKSLVTMKGGTIAVLSQKGQGSEFKVDLPFNGAKANENEDRSPVDAKTTVDVKGLKVLLVEDNPVNQRLMKKVLSMFGMEVMLAENGLLAIECLKKEAFALVLMDIQIPELDGYETTRYVRQELKLDVPIMAMTAHVMAGERERCFEEGMNDYLAKPFQIDELKEKIQHLLASKH